MARWAMVKDGQVLNVIEWDGKAFWQVPEGITLIESEVIDRHDAYDHATETITKVCNGKRYHKSCKYADYIQDKGHIE